MLVELETGGNIRLEDGKPSDLWYSSCVDLVKSRFFVQDFQDFGITGLNVVRVTRVHNRFLRNRFEEQLETVVDVQDGSYKRSLEYLFYGDSPSLPGELNRAVEDGFRRPSEYAAMGLDGAICVSNSVSIADLPRLQALAGASGGAGGAAALAASGGYDPQGKRGQFGQLVVTKVYLGKCAQDTGLLAQRKSFSGSAGVGSGGAASAKGGSEGRMRVTRDLYPDFSSVFTAKPSDPKQRLLYMFDNALVLPEYIVEFEYEFKHHAKPSAGPLIPQSSHTPACLEKLELEMHSIARPLLPFVQAGDSAISGAGAEGVGVAPLNAGDKMCRGSLAMPPKLPRQPPVYALNPDTLGRAAERAGGQPGQPADQTTCISLHGNNIRRIEGLGQYRALTALVLSFNEIQRIEGLGELAALKHLDLSYNTIARIEGLQGLGELRTLLLSHNQISVLEDVNVLKKYVPQLRQLALDNNPMSRGNKAYRPLVLRRLGGLRTLDGAPVTEEELSQGFDSSCTLTLQMIKENCTLNKKSGWMAANMQPMAAQVKEPEGGRLPEAAAAAAAVASGGGGAAAAAGGSGESDALAWRGEVHEIVLDHKKLRRVQNLEGFKKLKRIAFGNNELTKIQGLAECSALEEVSLEDNRIADIEGFGGNPALRKIDLGKNRIQRIQNLGHLAALTQLSLEDNKISSLKGLSELSSLMELYIGNNSVATLRELNHIKGLPKLIIVDLLGNPLCGVDEYRLYTIYHLRKLKVLDGRGIEAEEVATAKQRFAGRLTLDFIEERLGDIVLQDLQELEITGARIRDISTAFAGNTFARLRELNLSSNFITDVTCLRHLPNIAILVLNSNKLAGARFVEPLARGPDESVTLSPAAQQAKSKKGRGGAPQSFPNLEALYLGGNGISSIPALGLAGLESLRVLHLNGNDIQRLEGLHGLPSLRELSLSKNRIKFVEPGAFQGLATLRSLNLEENYLKQLSNLGSLTSLQRLQAGFNRISDLGDLDHLTALRSLSDLGLNNNPMARKQSYRQAAIQRCVYLKALDGKPVTVEERKYADMALDQSEAGLAAQAAAQQFEAAQGGAKVPIKVTSMNFEALVVPGLGGAQLGMDSLAVGIEIKRPPTLDPNSGERPFRRHVALYSGDGSRGGSSGRREGRSGSGRR